MPEFVLHRGLVDVREHRAVAALVYKHKHIVNVFVWPPAIRKKFPAKNFVRDGFNTRSPGRRANDFWQSPI